MTLRLSFAIFFGFYSFAAMGTTHCKADEVTYFSCKIRNSTNVVSLCGSSIKGADASSFVEHGWLQYRFGKPDSNSVFSYPMAKTGAVSHFKGEFHSFADEENSRGYNDRVWFKNREAEYGVIVDQGSRYFYGVWVNVGSKHRSFYCDNLKEIIFGSSIGDDFTSLVRKLPSLE